MLEQLFGSKTRVKLLKLFFMKPDHAFFVRELSRMIDSQINAVRRELELLESIGLIKEAVEQGEKRNEAESANVGATLRRYYVLNTDSIVRGELHALLLKERIIGEQQFAEQLCKKTGKVNLLVLAGIFTGEKKAPTDLLIVGDVKDRTLAHVVEDYEKKMGFDIRYTSMTDKEFFDRRYVMDKFLYAVFEGRHVKIINVLEI